MMRVAGSTMLQIAHFSALNTLPTYFDYLPLSAWLATCLLIKEMIALHEWDTLTMLSISKKTILKLFLYAGLGLTLFSFLGKELVVHDLMVKAEQYRATTFKQHRQHTIMNRWFMISDRHFFYSSFIDTKRGMGKNLLYLTFDKNFSLQTTLSAPSFTIDTTNKKIIIKRASIFDAQAQSEKTTSRVELDLPNLFPQIKMQARPASLRFLVQSLFVHSSLFPSSLSHQLYREFLKRILWHVQLLILPALVFLFFSMSFLALHYRWLLMLGLYPVMVVGIAFADYLTRQGAPLFVLAVPYLLGLAFMLILTHLTPFSF